MFVYKLFIKSTNLHESFCAYIRVNSWNYFLSVSGSTTILVFVYKQMNACWVMEHSNIDLGLRQVPKTLVTQHITMIHFLAFPNNTRNH